MATGVGSAEFRRPGRRLFRTGPDGGTGASTARDHALPDPARFAGSKPEGVLKPRRLLGWRLFRRNLRPYASA